MTEEKLHALSAHRSFSGIEVDGTDFSVLITAQCDGLMGVRVIAHLADTGLRDRGYILSSEEIRALSFGLGHIKIGPASLECFAPSPLTPLYSTGFKMVIEPGMADELRAWLPRLAKAATYAAAMAREVDRRFDEYSPYHLHDFTACLAACIVLDNRPPGEAMEWASSNHWLGRAKGSEGLSSEHLRFLDAFTSAEMQVLMETAWFSNRVEKGNV